MKTKPISEYSPLVTQVEIMKSKMATLLDQYDLDTVPSDLRQQVDATIDEFAKGLMSRARQIVEEHMHDPKFLRDILNLKRSEV